MQDQLIADVIAVADGEIIGRIRLQKIFYLLEQAGLGSGLSLHYHHYGPYSRELDDAVSRAQAFNAVKEEIRHRQVDGMPYSVFTLSGGEKAPVKIGRIRVDPARELIRAMKDASSTVLELAATIYWLVKREKVADWKTELVRRKGVKTQKGRMDEAISLLDRLGISFSLNTSDYGDSGAPSEVGAVQPVELPVFGTPGAPGRAGGASRRDMRRVPDLRAAAA